MNATVKPVQATKAISQRGKVADYLCWSRMQAESGQSLEEIISRKERERRLNGGVFLWGVGNAPARIANGLARAFTPVPVVFSVMKSRPKLEDSAPARIVAWRRFIDADGAERDLPKYSVVTSRATSATRTKRSHYALMCYADSPLRLQRGVEHFYDSAYRNAGGTGAPVGPSQVTALVKRVAADGSGPSNYEVNLRAWLTGAYWVRLTDPVYVSGSDRSQLANGSCMDDKAWSELIDRIRSGPSIMTKNHSVEPLLL